MRKRSESFYAKNDDEFTEVYKRRRSLYERRKSRMSSSELNNLNINVQIMNNFPAYDDLELDELGVNSTFQITTIETSSEDEKEEENNLLNNIENLNLSLKAKNTKMFYEHLSKITKNIFEKKEILIKKNLTNNNLIYKPDKIIKLIRSKTFNDNDNEFYLENFDKEKVLPMINGNEFLSKNIDIVENTLKFLIMGESKIQKSNFISKIFEEKEKEQKSISGNLMIKKKNIKLLGHYIRLELLDTNSELSNSNMLDVYYKISDGMILIVDSQSPNSAYYIKDLLEKMKYEFHQNNFYNLLFLSISKKENNNLKDNKVKLNSIETESIIHNIENEYNYKFKNICLDDDDKFYNVMNKFFSISYLKKGRRKINKKIKEDNNNNIKDIRKDIRHISLVKKETNL